MSLNNLNPGILLIVFGVLILILPKNFRKPVSLIAAVIGFLSVFALNDNSNLIYSLTPEIKLNLISVDGLSYVFVIIFALIGIVDAIYSIDLQDKWEKGLAIIYSGSIIAATLAGDIISFIVFWEVAAFSATYLIYATHTRRSSKASLRYILMHTFGGNMLLVGLLMNYANTGSLAIPRYTGPDGSWAFWFVLIGVSVNAVVPPFNSWISDSYPEATISGTVYMCGYTTKLGVYAMIRIFAGTELLVYAGVFMALYGVLMAFLENNMRRLFSYHIMSQLGYMVTALAVGRDWGIDGATFHAFNNILYKGVLMMCSGAVFMATGKKNITDLGGLRKKMPITAYTFLVASLAIAGVPFLNGYASKFMVMHAVEGSGHHIAALMLTITSIGTWISVALKVNWFVFFGKPRSDFEVKPIPVTMKIAMMMGAAGCVVIGVVPAIGYRLMPHHMNVHPFVTSHIIEYLILFVGATFVFWLVNPIMLPHDELSIDFDWILRKPFTFIINVISIALNKFTALVDKLVLKIVHFYGLRLGNPYVVTEASENPVIRNLSLENEDHEIGNVIGITVTMVAIFTLIAMIVIN